QNQQQHHQFQHNGLHQDPGASQFDPASAAAAANGGSYMGDFSHNMYAGAPEIVSAPATVTHLPPIDSAGTLARHSSYFGMASVPAQGTFDSMSAAAAAAGTGHYLAAAAARGQQPYPSPMVVGRFNLGMPSAGTPGVIPTPPPASQMQGPPPLSAMGPGSMSVPSTPIRSIGMPRINGHAQSSTSQRKRYLCTVCQKMFARPSTLATHMHSHTGEKPYECTWDSCGKRFSVMSNLRRHQRIHERQRAKFANMQQQQQQQVQQQVQQQQVYHNDSDSSSGSTTPLASQMLHNVGTIGSPISQLGHHMLPPPPHFVQQSGMAGNPGSAMAQHHHMMSHPGQQQHSHYQQHQAQHHQQQQHHQHMSLHTIGSNGMHDELPDVASLSVTNAAAAAAAMSDPGMLPGISTSSSTINSSTTQNSLKE
ncbi:hypothetical protein GGF37_005886, partial [Kickxella alabastrina]